MSTNSTVVGIVILVLVGLSLPLVEIMGGLPLPWRMSRPTLVGWAASLVVPITIIVIAVRSPAETDPFFLVVVVATLFSCGLMIVVAVVEIAIAAKKRHAMLALGHRPIKVIPESRLD